MKRRIAAFVLMATMLFTSGTTVFASTLSAANTASTAYTASSAYTVQHGDNLSKIAATAYGDLTKWKDIYQANSDQIKDPNLIFTGMVLTLPASKASMTAGQFYALNGAAAYDVVKASSDSWVVESYDLITRDNILDTVVAYAGEDGNLKFNLDWPAYGGNELSSIRSIGEMSGVVEISRLGGNGGYAISFGRNADGTEFTASQRAVPSSSISYRVGKMNVDQYKAAIDAIVSGSNEAEKLSALKALGYSDDVAAKLIADYDAWFKRSEMVGDKGILANTAANPKYGFYGIAAPWKMGNVTLEGGSTQMNISMSFGTLIDAQIITDVASAAQ